MDARRDIHLSLTAQNNWRKPLPSGLSAFVRSTVRMERCSANDGLVIGLWPVTADYETQKHSFEQPEFVSGLQIGSRQANRLVVLIFVAKTEEA